MWRYFTYIGKYVYINVLHDFLESYNSSYHRTIKCAPKNVNKNNEKEIWKRISFKFNVGDKVRSWKSKNKFEKG